ncbi:ABC transporter permease [Desertimonas flava]|uniref:ABC transporter permease n=1 Tax=Desertimonas flava TaxID=2064846 RepID=UPI0013C41639|nr:ABC transporter permease [Desertimonas flava]
MADALNLRAPSAFPSALRLLGVQVRAQLTVLRRIPVALFFTVVLPLMMLVLFNALFGSADIDTGDGSWPLTQFYVASLTALTVVSGTFTNLVNMIPYRRQDGIMKRWRGSPLPRWVYLGGFVGSGIVLAFVAAVVMVLLGVVAYGTEIDPAKLPAALVTFVIAVAAFSALGVAVAGLVRNPDAAPAVANAIVLPLGFISDVFVAIEERPRWMSLVADVFPLRPFVTSMQAALNPSVDAPAFQWGRLAVVAAWGIGGIVLASRTFKWEPVADVGPSRRRGQRSRSPRAQSAEWRSGGKTM